MSSTPICHASAALLRHPEILASTPGKQYDPPILLCSVQLVDRLKMPSTTFSDNETYLEQEQAFKELRARQANYNEFIRGLTPKYSVVWFEIAKCYACLLATLFLSCKLELSHHWPAVFPLAAVFGSCIHYMSLFLHEGAHFLLAPSKPQNDLLCNLFLGIFIGQDVKNYREVHFEHHRKLGSLDDPERTYQQTLNLRFVLECLTGIVVLKVIRSRRNAAPLRHGRSARLTLLAIVLQMAILALALVTHRYLFALSWVLGITSIFPLLGALRQLLEHKPSKEIAHYFPFQATARIFEGPLSTILGGAGFDKHLLHHLEPQVSCTRLTELQEFLAESGYQSVLHFAKGSYGSVFKKLFSQ